MLGELRQFVVFGWSLTRLRSSGRVGQPWICKRRRWWARGSPQARAYLCAALSLNGPDSRIRLAVCRILCLSSK